MTTMTTVQAATKLGLSIRTIQRRCAVGKLTATKDARGRWIITMEDAMTDLPALTAHHPQLVRHGEVDRAEVLNRIDTTFRATAGDQPAELVDQLIALYREVALRHTDALWWGEQAGRHIGRVLQRELTAEDKARITELAARR